MESKPVDFPWGTVWKLPDGTIHRENGPAKIFKNGNIEYWKNNKIHRIDGPALIDPNGNEVWCINDRFITNQLADWAKEFNIDLNNLTDEDKQMIVLYWS